MDELFETPLDPENFPYLYRVLQAFPKCQPVGRNWKACCTSATHNNGQGDNNPSLSISIGVGGRILLYCYSGCTTEDICSGAGLELAELYCPSFEEPFPQISNSRTQTAFDPLLDEVYSFLLEQSPLDETRIKSLAQRGLSRDLALALQFGYIGSTQKLSHLQSKTVEKFGNRLASIPGFVRNNAGLVTFIGSDLKGLLVPMRDLEGRVVALKTRRSSGTPKYLIWSSPSAKAFTTLHFPLGFNPKAETVRITEGEIKADLAQYKTNISTLSISGVTQWRESLDVLEQIKPKKILIAFDYKDILEKPQIKQTLWEFGHELTSMGYDVGVETWKDTSCKGIDDALVENQEIVVDWGYFKQSVYACPTPEELGFPEIREADSFPTDILPEYLQSFVAHHHQAIGCPLDFIASSLFAVYARALGSSRCVAFRPGWQLLANLYMCLVGDPTSGKTPGSQAALKPLFQFQVREKRRHREEVTRYEEQLEAYKLDLTESRMKKHSLPRKPSKPKNKLRFYATDVTTETLTKYLHENYESRGNASMLLFIDELVAWLDRMNAYKADGVGADRQFYMSTYSNSPIDYGRKSTGEDFNIPAPSLTILGGTQKAKLARLSQDVVEELGNDNMDDGFFSRMLFVYPAFVRQKRTVTTLPAFSLEPYHQSLTRVFLLRPVLGHGTDADEYQPVAIPIEPDALDAYMKFVNQDIEDQQAGKIPYKLQSSWSKHEATLGKLALILHAMHQSFDEETSIDAPLTLVTMLRAIRLMNYFRSHLHKVYQVVNHDSLEETIEAFIRSAITNYEGRFPFHDLYRRRLFGVKDKEDALKICKLAELRGYGKLLYHKSKSSKEPHVFQLPHRRTHS